MSRYQTQQNFSLISPSTLLLSVTSASFKDDNLKQNVYHKPFLINRANPTQMSTGVVIVRSNEERYLNSESTLCWLSEIPANYCTMYVILSEVLPAISNLLPDDITHGDQVLFKDNALLLTWTPHIMSDLKASYEDEFSSLW